MRRQEQYWKPATCGWVLRRMKIDHDKICDQDDDEWETFLRDEGAHLELNSVLAKRMYEIDALEEWVVVAKVAAERCGFSFITPTLRAFRQWFIQSLLPVLEGPDSWQIRFASFCSFPENCTLDAVQSLAAEIGEVPSHQLFSNVQLLLADTAFLYGQLDVARTAAETIIKTEAERGENELTPEERLLAAIFGNIRVDRTNEARRLIGALLLFDARYDEAFDVFEHALKTAPTAGRGSLSSLFPEDPFRAALHEAKTILDWAVATTPEWVRAVGGLAETCPVPADAEYLWERFDVLLDGLKAMGVPQSDADYATIARQAIQRGHSETAQRVFDYLSSN